MPTPSRPAVVITRPRDRSAGLARALSARGLRPLFAPLIRTVPPRSWAVLDKALKRLRDFDAVAFASASAVEAFFTRTRLVLGKPPRCPHVVGAVGPATASALARHGWKADLIPEEGTGKGLGRAFCLARGTTVLLPRAAKGRPELPRLLRRAGVRLTVATAYRTVDDPAGATALKAALKNGTACVAFASGSAVAAARRALGTNGLRRLKTVAIGPATAGALRALGIVPAAVAKRHDAEGLAQACERAMK